MNATADPHRLRPEMASRRLVVLGFVRQFIDEHGGSPSLDEIAAGCCISKDLARYHVNALVREGQLLKRGGPRSLAMPSQIDEAKRQLRESGWLVDEAGYYANPPLPPPIVLDYDPVHGQTQTGGSAQAENGRKARGDRQEVGRAPSRPCRGGAPPQEAPEGPRQGD